MTAPFRCIKTDTPYPFEDGPRCCNRWRRWVPSRDQVRQFLSGQYIDVYENGKRSVRTWPVLYGVGPTCCSTTTTRLAHCFTLAHEGGHAMHHRTVVREAAFVTAAYTIFVAEVASTTNERFPCWAFAQDHGRPQGALPAAAACGGFHRGYLLHPVLFADF